MFEQYKDFLDLVFIGTLLSLAVVFVIRGLMYGHFKGPLIADDPCPEAEIIILDDCKNKKNYLKNEITESGKTYIFIDKSWDLERNTSS